ncbi:hypothetical protein B0H14DRAFT_2583394, partial [Mycena olivaceomarginata]
MNADHCSVIAGPRVRRPQLKPSPAARFSTRGKPGVKRTRSAARQRSPTPYSDSMAKSKTRSKKKATSPASTVADDSLPKCLVPGRTILATAPGALTWLNFDNYGLSPVVPLVRRDRSCSDGGTAAYNHPAQRRTLLHETSEPASPRPLLNRTAFCGLSRQPPPRFRKRFPSAFSAQPSVAPTEDDPYPVDAFYCTPLLDVRPSKARRAFVIPHVELVPVAYTLSDSDDEEEEADRERVLLKRPKRLPSSTTKPEGAPSLPGCFHVQAWDHLRQEEDGSSTQDPQDSREAGPPQALNGAYRGARPTTPPAAKLFDDEARASSSKTTADNRPGLLFVLSRTSSFCGLHRAREALRRSAAVPTRRNPRASQPKTRAEANPPAGERDKPNPRHV